MDRLALYNVVKFFTRIEMEIYCLKSGIFLSESKKNACFFYKKAKKMLVFFYKKAKKNACFFYSTKDCIIVSSICFISCLDDHFFLCSIALVGNDSYAKFN